jgi:hypothetical protein
MLTGAALLAILAIGGDAAQPPPCEPAECLRAVSSKTAVALVDLAEPSLVGHWTAGPGLAGSELYLFADHTYIFIEWADVMPETISDKGRWTMAMGLLTLSSDSDVVWDPRNDRRYLSLREGDGSEPLLFGVDRTLHVFEWLVEEDPKEAPGYFRAACREKVRTWSDAEAGHLKADLMKRFWRSSAFAR